MKEIVMQLEDERRTVDQYKEQVEKVCILNYKYINICINQLCLYLAVLE